MNANETFKLCATTASCGAAAVGYVYGRSDSHTQKRQEGTNGVSIHDTPINLGQFTEATPSTPASRTPQHRRPQSASIPPTISLWDKVEDTSAARKTGGVGLVDHAEQSSVWTPTSELGEGKQTIRTPWTRRMSTIAQSHDGSSLSSAQPSSPSLFSNGSNAPFFPSSQSTTPRNRLVKRSTSHRILHSASYFNSPQTHQQNTTFRRPATSHQRSEQLRLQSLQRELERPSEPDQIEVLSLEPGQLTAAAPAEADWDLYFEQTVIQLSRDTPLRGSSLSRGPSGFDSVRFVFPRKGLIPTLLKPSAVKVDPKRAKGLPYAVARQIVHEPLTAAETPQSQNRTDSKSPRARHSFSLGDIMSTPTPSSWKIRRGGSVRKPSLNEGISGRRAVSAPQRNNLSSSKTKAMGNGLTMAKDPDQIIDVVEEPDKSLDSRVTSSPLPPLQRLSAFDLDLLAVSPPDSPTQASYPADRSQVPPSPDDSSDAYAPPSLRIRPHRASRIPSDRASTVFSSDNEQSRVFSTDGDDFDRRSETVYDSIRTDATSSSHSGAKGQHAESVFQQQYVADGSPRGLEAVEDKLTQFTIGGVSSQEPLPTQERNAMCSIGSLSSSIDVQHQSQRSIQPGALMSNAALMNATRSRQGSTANPQNDEFWPIEEEDSTWGDPDGSFSGRVAQSVENDREDSRGDGSLLTSQKFLTADSAARNSLQTYLERGGRSTGRRVPASFHLRSQSVPLQPENQGYRFNNVSRLEAWRLGGKGVSEDWDGDFEFDEPEQLKKQLDGQQSATSTEQELVGVLVPPSILERQASVHGQFGQVKQFSQLVEELRVLHHKAHDLGILHGQSSELWREAEGIIDLATLDEDDLSYLTPHSPNSSSFDFEAFEDEQSTTNLTIKEQTPEDQGSSLNDGESRVASSPVQQQSTPTRPRQESIAKAKHILENMPQPRVTEAELVSAASTSPKKFHFDTTSLRDLVTRAGVVTRALAEIVRKAENTHQNMSTPERRAQTPSDPAFSQIFQNSPTPSSSRKSPRVHRRHSSNSFLKDSPSPAGSDRNGKISIMSVV